MNPFTCYRKVQGFLTALIFAAALAAWPSTSAADGGAYTFTFRGANTDTYTATPPSVLACPVPGGGAASNPLPGATFPNGTPSLSPQGLGLGQIVAFEVMIEVNGSTAPENGEISFTTRYATETTGGNPLGFDPSFGDDGIYCAFVDTSDPSNVGLDGDETLTIGSASVINGMITGTLDVEGLDNGDKVVVEIWVVLDDEITGTPNGKISTDISGAVTGAGDTINTGNKEVPINNLKDFFDFNADLSVQKSDTPDPVGLLSQLTYSVEVKNNSSIAVANGVTLTDTLDADTSFVSVQVTDTVGFVTTCSHLNGVVTCNLGFLETQETVTVNITVQVLQTADPGTGGEGPCTGSESLCNTASVTSINDTITANNSVTEPTGVQVNGPFAALLIDKEGSQTVAYSGSVVTYTYTVTNPSNFDVDSVSVSDDKCSPVSGPTGDDGDAVLEPSETWVFTCQATLNVDTTNTGTVSGTDDITGLPLQNTNQFTVDVINPSITLDKSANVATVPTNGPVVYTYVVDNTGDSPVTSVVVTDDKCTPVTFSSGDTNGNSQLDTTETWTFSCSTTLAVDTTNNASAVAVDLKGGNVPSNGDSVTVTIDNCPQDPSKTQPGICGCGVADTDTDGDGAADCNDLCVNDPGKVTPGICGCGTADTDTDGDGTADCNDLCVNDPGKTVPGQCGCGIADTDTDQDGTADCNDLCVNDPTKTAPGICGCGTADTDTDGDGTADCNDQCVNDPAKIEPGQCGCGVADTDTDQDGTADCNDQCVNDPNKTTPGTCGCGVADVDSDADGTLDCQDGCPADSAKIAAGACGCGVADTDSDGDGVADCNDQCVADPAKSAPGACGCGVADTDADNNGVADCLCQNVDVTAERNDLGIGPEQLAIFARETQKRLIRAAKKTNPGLAKRLIRSSKSAEKKMLFFIALANQQLDQLPNVVLVCPADVRCFNVDNSSKIITYRGAVISLANVVIRTLNRATRLVFPSVLIAKKKTRVFGKTVKGTRDALVVKANAIPAVQSFCAGG